MATTPKNKAAAPAAVKAVTVYELTSPNGKEYATSSRAEALNLHRSAGYVFKDPKVREEDVEGLEQRPEGDAPPAN